MKTDTTTVTLDSIDAYNKLFGLTTLHPLVSVIDLKKATRGIWKRRESLTPSGTRDLTPRA